MGQIQVSSTIPELQPNHVPWKCLWETLNVRNDFYLEQYFISISEAISGSSLILFMEIMCVVINGVWTGDSQQLPPALIGQNYNGQSCHPITFCCGERFGPICMSYANPKRSFPSSSTLG